MCDRKTPARECLETRSRGGCARSLDDRKRSLQQLRLEQFSLVRSTRSWYFSTRRSYGCVLHGSARARLRGPPRRTVVERGGGQVPRQSRLGRSLDATPSRDWQVDP